MKRKFNLRRARKAKGLTIDELSKLCGLTYSHCQAIESGRLSGNPAALLRIGMALDVDPNELLSAEEMWLMKRILTYLKDDGAKNLSKETYAQSRKRLPNDDRT